MGHAHNPLLEFRLDSLRESLDALSAVVDENLRTVLLRLTCDEAVATEEPLVDIGGLARTLPCLRALSASCRTPSNTPECGQGANIWPCPHWVNKKPRRRWNVPGHGRNPRRFRLMQRTCAVCGSEFHSPYSSARYCSDGCRHTGQVERNREWYRANYRSPQHGSRCCGICGREFVPEHGNQRSCSDECRAIREKRRSARKFEAAAERARTCHKCGGPTNTPGGRPGRAVCDGCRGSRPRTEHERKRRLLLYGLTVEQYDALWERQGRCCGICGTAEPTKKGWVIDHCHDTDNVRGILCSRCNVGIGMLGDSLDNIAKAGWYLANAAV